MITAILVFVIVLLCGLIAILIILRKYLTLTNGQMYYQNQADNYQMTQVINTDQNSGGQQFGEVLHRDIPPKIVGTKKLNNTEKKKKKKQVRDEIIEIQKVKYLQQLHDRNEKAEEELEIRANLNAEIRKREGNLELRYKRLAEDIELILEGCEGELNETLLDKLIRFKTIGVEDNL